MRILIIEDHTLFAESLDLALTMEGYDVQRLLVAEAPSSPGALLAAITRSRPHIVLLDLDLGRLGDGTRLIAPIVHTGAQVVVVTGSADRGRWGECLRFGARKVVTKARPLNEILATVRRLNQGLPVMGREERDELLQAWQSERLRNQESRERLERLTPRETEVLTHLMRGHTVTDIARTSVVSEATVRTQVKAILAKLGVSSQLAAVGLAYNVGWQPPSPRDQSLTSPRR